MKSPAHPVDDAEAAAFHFRFVIGYALAMLFHAVATWNHWRDSRKQDKDTQ